MSKVLDDDAWRAFFAALTGDPEVDAELARVFCKAYTVTPERVLAEMRARCFPAPPSRNN
jgi:hypothetical protein